MKEHEQVVELFNTERQKYITQLSELKAEKEGVEKECKKEIKKINELYKDKIE